MVDGGRRCRRTGARSWWFSFVRLCCSMRFRTLVAPLSSPEIRSPPFTSSTLASVDTNASSAGSSLTNAPIHQLGPAPVSVDVMGGFVISEQVQIDGDADMGGKDHFADRCEEPAVRAIVIGEEQAIAVQHFRVCPAFAQRSGGQSAGDSFARMILSACSVPAASIVPTMSTARPTTKGVLRPPVVAADASTCTTVPGLRFSLGRIPCSEHNRQD